MPTKAEKSIMAGLADAIAFAEGDASRARVHTPLGGIDIKAIRSGSGMSQEKFAKTYRIPVGTLRNWEQGHRPPDMTAQAYLRVIAANPEAVKKALADNPAA